MAADPLLDQFVRRVVAEVRARHHISLLITSRTTPTFLESAEQLPGLTADGTHTLLDSRGVALPSDLVQRLTAATSGNVQLLLLAIDALQQR